MNPLHTFPITLTGEHPEKKRQEIKEYFLATYELFERIFDLLASDEVYYRQSEPTRHPMIFYFGHTATFFINKLILGKVITERINPEYESMFAVGVDEMSWDDLDEEHYRWPAVYDVRCYRAEVKQAVTGLIETLPLSLPIKPDDPFWIILMGIEHERIHIETSSVLHRQMPIKYIKESDLFLPCRESVKAPQNTMVEIEGGHVVLGKGRDHHLYGWDNEYGHHEVDVASFKASKYLVSNGEFMAFVKEGGYENEAYWDDEGKKFLAIRGASHPVFWVEHPEGKYRYRTLTKIIEMPLDWPVDVNCLEAMAFCRWKSEKDNRYYRLPSEVEWYRLYERAGIKDVPEFDDTKANINLRYFASSCPVDKFAFGDICDVVGNVWQWTQTHFDAFAGFETHPIYDDFSTPTFDGRHNVMKGGSWISTGNEIMKHSRYAFRRHFYQHAGFRYVEAAPLEEEKHNIYESDMAVSQYCEFQYGEACLGVRNFAVVCAELADGYAKGTKKAHALDIGCATGRTSFELARRFEKVTGIDFSTRFVQVGVELQRQGKISYRRCEEGVVTSLQQHTLAEFGLEGVKERVTFWQGDACNLKAHFAGYDLVLATNLIDRLYEPELFLRTLHERLNDGGVLVITSPYTWDEAYTKKEHWLGGYYDENGHAVSTFETLTKILQVHFELIECVDVPFVIRETPRKFQYTRSQMSAWKKRDRV